MRKLDFYLKIALVLSVLVGILFRAQDLGYSNLQGDEINTLDYLYPGEEFSRYFWDQKRGPTQYLINYANTSLFGYINETQVRLPYLLLGVLAIGLTYLLAKEIFNEKAAGWAAALQAVSGLFIAFSRIVQYQTAIFCLLPASLILFIRGMRENCRAKVVWAALLFAAAVISHYDSLSAGFFLAPFLVSYAISQTGASGRALRWTGWLVGISLPLAAAFYLPFSRGDYFSQVTEGYLRQRLLGGGLMPRINIIRTILNLYVPDLVLIFLFLACLLGLLSWSRRVGPIKIGRWVITEKVTQVGYLGLLALLAGATWFSLYPVKPRTATVLVVGSCLGLTALLVFSKRIKPVWSGLAGWFLINFALYFFLFKDVRTHVYTVFLPAFILAGYGVSWFLGEVKSKSLQYLFLAICLGLVVFQLGFAGVVFVDKNPEFPWWQKDLFGWTIYKTSRNAQDKPEGVFGLPYYRGWERVGEGFRRGCLVGDYTTNEKTSIPYFYLGFAKNDQKDDVENIIKIEGPHSWNFVDVSEAEEGYHLIKVIKSRYQLPVAYLYGREDLYPDQAPLCDF